MYQTILMFRKNKWKVGIVQEYKKGAFRDLYGNYVIRSVELKCCKCQHHVENCKAAAVDGVTGEMLKYGCIYGTVLRECEDCIYANDWTNYTIVPLCKVKDRKSDCKNYRRIIFFTCTWQSVWQMLTGKI